MQLTVEIQERQDFIEAMRSAGKSKEHEAYIQAEISDRMRQLQGLVDRDGR